MECREGPPGLEPDGEAAPEVGGGATSVCHVSSGGDTGSPPFWGGDLGFVRGDVQEDGGGTCGVTKEDNRAEGGAAEGRDLLSGGIREGT